MEHEFLHTLESPLLLRGLLESPPHCPAGKEKEKDSIVFPSSSFSLLSSFLLLCFYFCKTKPRTDRNWSIL